MQEDRVEEDTRCQLSLFGGPLLSRAEQSVEFTTYQSALIALVACSLEPIRRSQLVNLLYGTYDTSIYRRRISQLTYSVNRRAEFDLLKGSLNAIQLNRAVVLDVRRLTSPLPHPRAPVVGMPLARIQAPYPSEAFESWLIRQRASLEDVRQGVNVETLELAWSTGDLRLAREVAEELLTSAPSNRRALRIFVKVLTIQEGRAAAMAWLAGHTEQHLKKDPSSIDWMDSERFPEVAGCSHEPKDPSASGTRFVGRTQELAQVVEVSLASDTIWAGLLIQGEAGSGKSRFLHELQRRLVPEDCHAVVVELRFGDSLAAFSLVRLMLDSPPFREALERLPPHDRSVLEAAVGKTEEPTVEKATLQSAEDRQRRVLRVFDSLVRLIDRRLVVMIDNIRFTDRSSLAALNHVRRAGPGSPLRLICTDRCGGKQGNMRRARVCEILAINDVMMLSPLTSEHARELAIDFCKNRQLDDQRLDRVVQLSGGNPLFLIELTRAYSAEEHIDANPAALKGLGRLIDATLRRLQPNTRALLKVLSVQLGPTSLDTVSALSKMGCSDLLVCVEEAQEAELLSSGPPGIAFRHGLLQEWLYHSLTPAERRFLHLTTASYLKDQSGFLPDLAFHLHRGGHKAAAAKATLAAANDALERGACADAIAFLEMALDNALSDTDRFRTLEQLSLLYELRGNLTDALQAAESALRLDKGHIDQPSIWTLRIRRAAAAAELGTESPRRLQEELSALIAEADQHEDSWLRALDTAVTLANSTLQHSRARALLYRLKDRTFTESRLQCRAFLLDTFHLAHGSPAIAVDASEAAIRLAEQHDHRDLLMRAICRAVIVESWQATLTKGQIENWKMKVSEIARETGDIRGLWTFHVNVATWFIDTSRTDIGELWIREAKRITDGAFDSVMDIGLENNLGELYLLEGDYETALPHFRRAAAAPQSMRREIHLSACGGLGYCLLAQGHMRKALRVDAELPPNRELVQITSFDPSTLILFRSRISSIQGQLAEALKIVRDSRDRLRDRHVPAWFKLGRVELRILRRLGAHRGHTECLGALLERADELNLDEVLNNLQAKSR